jgi:hypothetical protein
MLLSFEITTIFLTAATMSMALAYTLEFPGKLRLDEIQGSRLQELWNQYGSLQP